jgi:3-dehydroquinate dehydratase-2
MKFLVINGPNINMLGIREPDIYGRQNYKALVAFIGQAAEEAGVSAEVFQSNCEGEIVTAIQKALGNFDGIVINPAAYTHTSIAILDALKAVGLPAVEVHLTDIAAREPFRQLSYTGMYCVKTFKGLGFEGYRQAIFFLRDYVAVTLSEDPDEVPWR